MSKHRRTSKEAAQWTHIELVSYNIKVDGIGNPLKFFNCDFPDALEIDEDILYQESKKSNDQDAYTFLRLLYDSTIHPHPHKEDSAVIDFTHHVLRLLEYTPIGRIARTRKRLPFKICGVEKAAVPNICILDERDFILLVVQEETDHIDPEPRLVAQMIAAFSCNNHRRQQLGLPPLDSHWVNGIIMIKTAPVFYRFRVTSDLVTAIQSGIYPKESSVVLAHVPDVEDQSGAWKHGMVPLKNRGVMLECFEMFKHYLDEPWLRPFEDQFIGPPE